MEAFKTLNGIVMPLDRANVDTDMIIPAVYLKSIKRTGFEDGLFANMRYNKDGTPNPDFVLNQPRYKNASILVSRENFGCGSSREHAPWALQQYGFKVIIASSFADIFYNNSFNIGLLPIILKPEEIEELFQEVENEPMLRLKVNLEEGTVTAPGGKEFHFEIDPFKKESLLKGLDNIGWTLQYGDLIEDYEAKRQAEQPWLYAGQSA
ncbi:MAG: 3-isopropylmalate dehydratase small subunit [Chloroflexi bacterium]|nr:3-isopropylmalate dehydratase small subunit [Chloroflexota bacterium]OJV89555.1 MAG: 3-isopropylmalate dehydratase small subunit [Chloroflexi bacterium 54-19]